MPKLAVKSADFAARLCFPGTEPVLSSAGDSLTLPEPQHGAGRRASQPIMLSRFVSTHHHHKRRGQPRREGLPHGKTTSPPLLFRRRPLLSSATVPRPALRSGMDSFIDIRFERLEKALASLVDSVTKYHPSPSQAEELKAADAQLSLGLQQGTLCAAAHVLRRRIVASLQ